MLRDQLKKVIEDRQKFWMKWRWQIIGSGFLSAVFYLGTPQIGWLVSHLNPPLVLMFFCGLAVRRPPISRAAAKWMISTAGGNSA